MRAGGLDTRNAVHIWLIEYVLDVLAVTAEYHSFSECPIIPIPHSKVLEPKYMIHSSQSRKTPCKRSRYKRHTFNFLFPPQLDPPSSSTTKWENCCSTTVVSRATSETEKKPPRERRNLVPGNDRRNLIRRESWPGREVLMQCGAQ